MKIIRLSTAEAKETNTYYINWEDYSQEDSSRVLLIGYDTIYKIDPTAYQAVGLFNVWAPTEFAQKTDHYNTTPIAYDSKATRVYSICPYTTDWLNEINTNKYKYIRHPIGIQYIPEFEKEYDACYVGNLHSELHIGCLDVIKKFKYFFSTVSQGMNSTTAARRADMTALDLTHYEKLDQVAKNKISIAINLVPITEQHKHNIKSNKAWEQNVAFERLEDNIIPQFKSRVHEAAICKTLNLVYKDPWNLIEDYYTPDKDFIYFDSLEDLKDKIHEISSTYHKYTHIVDNAFEKVKNYSTKNTYNTIKKDLDAQQ